MMNLAWLLGWLPFSMKSPWRSLPVPLLLSVQLEECAPERFLRFTSHLRKTLQNILRQQPPENELDITVDTSNCGWVPQAGTRSHERKLLLALLRQLSVVGSGDWEREYNHRIEGSFNSLKGASI
jgi:hypothetical protein